MKGALVQNDDESKEIEGRSLRFETTVRELERTLLVRTGTKVCEMREREMCMLHDEDTRTNGSRRRSQRLDKGKITC